MVAVRALVVWAFLAVNAFANCSIFRSDGAPAPIKHDPFFQLLTAGGDCPTTAQALKAQLKAAGLAVRPAMVANRGHHNPDAGSFSFFERVSGRFGAIEVNDGDFFFGHFTGLDGNQIVLDQAPDQGKLLVELLVRDAQTQLYNFYELIGTGTGARWFYRGDSADALHDNRFLYLTPPAGQPKFGARMRCSGCHSTGGPIVKEMTAPHNDWWTTARGLEFGKNRRSDEIVAWMQDLVDADAFADSVRSGIDRLETSVGYRAVRAALTLQERLRPLFCENEINLESDRLPLASRATLVTVPSASLVNPILASGVLQVSKVDYQKILAARRMQFPETRLPDADHPWLTPVKGYSDLKAIQALVDEHIVDAEFIADVLAVDAAHPLFSRARCQLLSLVPPTAAGDWQRDFREALRASSLSGAKELLANLEDPSLDRNHHQRVAQERLATLRVQLTTTSGAARCFDELIATRRNAFASEISKNPRGQILEPGFRVIFPVPGRP